MPRQSRNLINAETDRSLLVIRFSALGDVAMTIPVVYSLARQYPDLKIYFATTPFFSRLFLNPPPNLRLVACDLKNDYRGVKGLLRLFRRLKDLKPDAVADLHNMFRTWMLDSLFRLSGVKVAMVDKMRGKRSQVLREKTPQPSFISRYEKVFEDLGFPLKSNFKSLFEENPPFLPFTPENSSVGFAPFARYANKAYPLDLVRETIKSLTENGHTVYLFGARGKEAETLEQIADEIPGAVSLAGKYSIEEELALISAMKLMISMDSANHHLASLAGTPCISIWGSTTPACGFMAYGQPIQNALLAGLSCQPCTIAGSNSCHKGDFPCLRAISPSRIAALCH